MYICYLPAKEAKDRSPTAANRQCDFVDFAAFAMQLDDTSIDVLTGDRVGNLHVVAAEKVA